FYLSAGGEVLDEGNGETRCGAAQQLVCETSQATCAELDVHLDLKQLLDLTLGFDLPAAELDALVAEHVHQFLRMGGEHDDAGAAGVIGEIVAGLLVEGGIT